MPFSDKEVEEICSIFIRLEPGIVHPIQYHKSEGLTRTGYIFGVKNKKRQYNLLYQNYYKLSPFRLKLLRRLAKKIPYKLQITHPNEDLTCVGWKCD